MEDYSNNYITNALDIPEFCRKFLTWNANTCSSFLKTFQGVKWCCHNTYSSAVKANRYDGCNVNRNCDHIHYQLLFHGWPCTQHNRIPHNLAAHHRAAHNPVARQCAGLVVCDTRMSNQPSSQPNQWDSNVGWANTDPTSDDSTDIGPTLGQHTLLSGQTAHNLAKTPPSHWVVCSMVVCC